MSWVPPKSSDGGADAGQLRRRRHRGRIGRAKLTGVEVLVIRALSAAGRSYEEIGREFGVTASTVSNITRRITWKDVP